jgi:hypothetical protein
MSTIITGIVTNGVVVPASPLPEGAHVEVSINAAANAAVPQQTLTLDELLKLPREQRREILAAGAPAAEELYRTNKELMGWGAVSEELDDDSD